MRATASIVEVKELSPEQRDDMFALTAELYRGIDRKQFEAQLGDDGWVILLSEQDTIRGYTAQRLVEETFEGRPILVICTGDPVISRSHWGTDATIAAWRYLIRSIQAEHPERELYWMSTSRSYMTYRHLPVFFHDFYPRHSVGIPEDMGRLVDSLGTQFFPESFDPVRRVLRGGPTSPTLRTGVADITEPLRRDPHVSFFERANPGHVLGDALVCITRCDDENLRPLITRSLVLS